MLKSDCTLDFAGTKATSADVEAFNLAVDDSAHALDIRLPFAFSLKVRMAYVHTRHRALLTNLAVS